MPISPIGILLIPLGLVLFLAGTRPLFWATVIATQFYYTKVLDVGTVVSPTIWFGGLLILRKLLGAGLSGGRVRSLALPGWRTLAMFFAAVVLSAFLPRLLASHVQVASLATTYLDYATAPLRFRLANVTQIAFPVFMVAMMLALRSEIRDRATLQRVIRVCLVCATLVLGSGLLFQFGRKLHITPVVDGFFWLFTGTMELHAVSQAFGSFSRMFSLAGEPGYTGAYLLLPLGIAGMAAFAPVTLPAGWPRSRMRLMFVLALAGILLTGGTTGLAGMALFAASLVLFGMIGSPRAEGLQAGAIRHVAVRILAVMALFTVLVVAVWPAITGRSFVRWLVEQHVQKVLVETSEGSGDIRMETILTAMDIFVRFPLLGVGYGSHRTSALLPALLSNVGLLGTLPFLAFNGILVLTCIRVFRRAHDATDSVLAAGLACALISFLGVALVSKGLVTFLFGYYWLLLAVIAALPRIAFGPPDAPSSNPPRLSQVAATG
jgi:hypothetical protein